MANRSRDWLNQAIRDLDQARSSQSEGRHEWPCFAAQQPAEKAVKALPLPSAQEAWGHMVTTLLMELPGAAPAPLVERAKVSDNYYTPTRYHNGHPEGAPFEHYGQIHSGEAIQYAGEIVEFVSVQMA